MAGGARRQTGKKTDILVEAILNGSHKKVSVDPRKRSGHAIVVGYAGHVFSCDQDSRSIRSVHTLDSDDEDSSEDSTEDEFEYKSKPSGAKSTKATSVPKSYRKKSPKSSAKQPTASLKSSQKKHERSRTHSPPEPPKRRSLLAPFSNLSRKLSMRRQTRDTDAKIRQKKVKQVQPEDIGSPLPPKRPILQPRAHTGYTYIQPAMQIPHQLQPPVYCYIPLHPSQNSFNTVPQPTTNLHSAAPQSSCAPPSQLPQDLIQVQNEINRLTAALASSGGGDAHCRAELNRLTAQRNSMLDSATGQRMPAVPKSTSEQAKACSDQAAVTTGKNDSKESQKEASGNVSGDVSGNVSDKDDDQASTSQYHVCSGCGQTRSASFHHKHPFTKPIHNICKNCREGDKNVGVMNRYHFCQACGIVRSKEYQRHHITPKASSTRGYRICRKCYSHRQSTNHSLTEEKTLKSRPSPDEQRQKPVPPVKLPQLDVQPEAVATPSSYQSTQKKDHLKQKAGMQASCHDYCAEINEVESFDDIEMDKDSLNQAKETTPILDKSTEQSNEDSVFSRSELPEVPLDFPSPSFNGDAQFAFRSLSPDLLSQFPKPKVAANGNMHNMEQERPKAQNPYYQPPGVNIGKISSLFSSFMEDISQDSFHSSQRNASQSSEPSKGEKKQSSPELQETTDQPEFVNRNKSWPGNLRFSPSGAFPTFTESWKKVSISEGVKTPEISPSLPEDHQHGYESNTGRFTNGAFGKFSTSYKSNTPASPWANFSGSIPNPVSGSGSKGAFFDYREQDGRRSYSDTPFGPRGMRESIFGTYNNRDDFGSSSDYSFRFGGPRSYSSRNAGPQNEFGSTRGAWNMNTSFSNSSSRSSAFGRRGEEEIIPEPIIEEPCSPRPKTPVKKPLLLDELSDSGVEFLTDSSSSSAPSLSAPSSEDTLASNMATLALNNV